MAERIFRARRFSWKERGRSFGFAWAGILGFLRSEHNARLHLLATLAAIVLSVAAGISRMEAVGLALCIALVWITEIVNTAIEKAMDMITEEWHPQVKLVKDMAAAAVLLAAIVALLIGCIIFLPKFF